MPLGVPKGVPKQMWAKAEPAFYRSGGLANSEAIADFLNTTCKITLQPSVVRELLQESATVADAEEQTDKYPSAASTSPVAPAGLTRKESLLTWSRRTTHHAGSSSTPAEGHLKARGSRVTRQRSLTESGRRSTMVDTPTNKGHETPGILKGGSSSLPPLTQRDDSTLVALELSGSGSAGGQSPEQSPTHGSRALRVARYDLLTDDGPLTLYQFRALLSTICLQIHANNAAEAKKHKEDEEIRRGQEDAYDAIRGERLRVFTGGSTGNISSDDDDRDEDSLPADGELQRAKLEKFLSDFGLQPVLPKKLERELKLEEDQKRRLVLASAAKLTRQNSSIRKQLEQKLAEEKPKPGQMISKKSFIHEAIGDESEAYEDSSSSSSAVEEDLEFDLETEEVMARKKQERERRRQEKAKKKASKYRKRYRLNVEQDVDDDSLMQRTTPGNSDDEGSSSEDSDGSEMRRQSFQRRMSSFSLRHGAGVTAPAR